MVDFARPHTQQPVPCAPLWNPPAPSSFPALVPLQRRSELSSQSNDLLASSVPEEVQHVGADAVGRMQEATAVAIAALTGVGAVGGVAKCALRLAVQKNGRRTMRAGAACTTGACRKERREATWRRPVAQILATFEPFLEGFPDMLTLSPRPFALQASGCRSCCSCEAARGTWTARRSSWRSGQGRRPSSRGKLLGGAGRVLCVGVCRQGGNRQRAWVRSTCCSVCWQPACMLGRRRRVPVGALKA